MSKLTWRTGAVADRAGPAPMTTAQASRAGPAEGCCWHGGESVTGTCRAGQRLSQTVALSAGISAPMSSPATRVCAASTSRCASAGAKGRRGGQLVRPHRPQCVATSLAYPRGGAEDLTPPHPWAAHRSAGACSTTCPAGLARPCHCGPAGPPGAIGQHSERRSNDGQPILKAPLSRPETGPDLLLRRAPLRNRTVDLLLTIYPRDHAVANCGDAGQVRGGALCCRPTYLFIQSGPGDRHIRQRSCTTSPNPWSWMSPATPIVTGSAATDGRQPGGSPRARRSRHRTVPGQRRGLAHMPSSGRCASALLCTGEHDHSLPIIQPEASDQWTVLSAVGLPNRRGRTVVPDGAQTGKSGTSAGRAAAPAEPAFVARRRCGQRLGGLGEGDGVAEGFELADVVASFAALVDSGVRSSRRRGRGSGRWGR